MIINTEFKRLCEEKGIKGRLHYEADRSQGIIEFTNYEYFLRLFDLISNNKCEIYEVIENRVFTGMDEDHPWIKCYKTTKTRIDRKKEMFEIIKKLDNFVKNLSNKYEIGKKYKYKYRHYTSNDFLFSRSNGSYVNVEEIVIVKSKNKHILTVREEKSDYEFEIDLTKKTIEKIPEEKKYEIIMRFYYQDDSKNSKYTIGVMTKKELWNLLDSGEIKKHYNVPDMKNINFKNLKYHSVMSLINIEETYNGNIITLGNFWLREIDK